MRGDGPTGFPKGMVQSVSAWVQVFFPATRGEDKELGDRASKAGVIPREQGAVTGTSRAGICFLQDLLSSLGLQNPKRTVMFTCSHDVHILS